MPQQESLLDTIRFTEAESMEKFAMSLGMMERVVRQAINKKYPRSDEMKGPYPWIRDMFTDSVVYDYDGQLLKCSYSIVDGEATLGKPQKVQMDYVAMSKSVIQRDAKLFEAGDYKDKGLKITEADLDGIATGFAEVPVKVEHSDTPFDGFLGSLSKVWRNGKDLMGKIGFTKEAWALIDAANARKLSIGLKRDKSGLTEVSLVKNPRVEGAAVFDDRIELSGGEVESDSSPETLAFASNLLTLFSKSQEGNMPGTTPQAPGAETGFTRADAQALVEEMREATEAKFNTKIADLQNDNATLRAQLRESDADKKLDALKRAGKITPAMEPFAKSLLMADSGEIVTFGDQKMTAGDAVLKMLESAPEIVKFREQGGQGEKPSATEYSAEQLEVFRKLGILNDKGEVDAEKVAKFNQEGK